MLRPPRRATSPSHAEHGHQRRPSKRRRVDIDLTRPEDGPEVIVID
jgi:hypothetical protein